MKETQKRRTSPRIANELYLVLNWCTLQQTEYTEDKTWVCVKTWNFSSCVQLDISQVSCASRQVEHEWEIPYLEASMHYSVYYMNILITTFLTILRRFPNTFQRFPKARQSFSNISEISKISKDNRRFPRKNRWCMFRSYKNISRYFSAKDY